MALKGKTVIAGTGIKKKAPASDGLVKAAARRLLERIAARSLGPGFELALSLSLVHLGRRSVVIK